MKRFAFIGAFFVATGMVVSLNGCSHISQTDARESSLTKGLDVYEIKRINEEARVRNASVIWINPPERTIEEPDPEQEKERDAP